MKPSTNSKLDVSSRADVEKVVEDLQELNLHHADVSEADDCCKGQQCLKTISQEYKEICHQTRASKGINYVSLFIHPHVEGPPDTRQYFIYRIPAGQEACDDETVVCQKAFVEIFGLSQYALQQAQGAAINRLGSRGNLARDRGTDRGSSPQSQSKRASGIFQHLRRSTSPESPHRRESGIFQRLRKSVSKRLKRRQRRDRSPIDARRNARAKVPSAPTVIDKVEFDLEKAKTRNKPHTLGKFHQKNNTSSRQSATWKTSQTKTTTRTYEIQWNDTTSISSEAELTINLPMIGGGEVSLGAAHTASIGSRRSEESGEVDRWEFDLPGTVEPMSELTIVLKAEKCEILVPVTATLRKGGRVWRVDGVYKGTQYVNAEVVYK